MKIDRVHSISKKEFLIEYFQPGRPVLIQGSTTDWPALDKWSPDFFMEKKRRVRVEFGNVLHDRPRFQEMEIAEYMKLIQNLPLMGSFHDLKTSTVPIPYLAYFDIFKCFPELKRDVDFFLWGSRLQFPIAWIGPSGTFTGLHWDVLPNLFAQIYGSKEFILYPPDQEKYLYPSFKYDEGSYLSSVDSRNPDFFQFPLFRYAEGIRVIVRAGDILFTPRRWWHQVFSMETSISVSCFSADLKDGVLYALPEAVRRLLHRAGLYRKGNCACHQKGYE